MTLLNLNHYMYSPSEEDGNFWLLVLLTHDTIPTQLTSNVIRCNTGWYSCLVATGNITKVAVININGADAKVHSTTEVAICKKDEMLKCEKYKAKLLFHQSPTRNSHYSVTGQWLCSHHWQLPVEQWLHRQWQPGHRSAGSCQRSLHSHCPVTV